MVEIQIFSTVIFLFLVGVASSCTPNCLNGGSCLNNVCRCQAGFMGKSCEINVNECLPKPCKNGGACKDLVNDYKCTCAAGFTGKNCEININDCSPNPCINLNGGACKDLVNGFKCTCAAGFTGKNCEININDCTPNPCINGGACKDLVNGFKCTCAAGFNGKNCEININDCLPNPCKNGGRCTDLLNAFKCSCVVGFNGKNCEVNIDDCRPNPCTNDGTCTDLVNGFKCACAAGFTGKNCQININECASNPCLNSASCIDKVNGFQCLCPKNTIGPRCRTNPCLRKPCDNGGVCIPSLLGDRYKCNCTNDFFGQRCELACSKAKPCHNYGQCINDEIRTYCKCQPGYNGTRCQNKQKGPLLCGLYSNQVTINENGTVVSSSKIGQKIAPCTNSTKCSLVNYLLVNKLKNQVLNFTAAYCDSDDSFCKHFCPRQKEAFIRGSHIELKTCSFHCCKTNFCNLKPVSKEPPTVVVPKQDPCSSKPCRNGGTCHVMSAKQDSCGDGKICPGSAVLGKYTCSCTSVFSGQNCAQGIPNHREPNASSDELNQCF